MTVCTLYDIIKIYNWYLQKSVNTQWEIYMKLEEFKSKFEDKNKDFNGNTTNVVRSYAKYLYKGAAKEISKCDVSELCAKYNYVKNSNYAEDWFYANNV